jgi:hypothetical protein
MDFKICCDCYMIKRLGNLHGQRRLIAENKFEIEIEIENYKFTFTN